MCTRFEQQTGPRTLMEGPLFRPEEGSGTSHKAAKGVQACGTPRAGKLPREWLFVVQQYVLVRPVDPLLWSWVPWHGLTGNTAPLVCTSTTPARIRLARRSFSTRGYRDCGSECCTAG